MQILGLFGMYFDAVLVEVKTFLLLFRLTQARRCFSVAVLDSGHTVSYNIIFLLLENLQNIYMFTKGQSISKGLLGVFKPTKKPQLYYLK